MDANVLLGDGRGGVGLDSRHRRVVGKKEQEKTRLTVEPLSVIKINFFPNWRPMSLSIPPDARPYIATLDWATHGPPAFHRLAACLRDRLSPLRPHHQLQPSDVSRVPVRVQAAGRSASSHALNYPGTTPVHARCIGHAGWHWDVLAEGVVGGSGQIKC